MKRRSFLLGAAGLVAAPCNEPLELHHADGRVDVLVKKSGKPLTSFHYDSKWDKPFLFPLRTPQLNKTLSRGWPVEPKPGDTIDHTWQRGIWWGHGDINKVDFWRELGRTKTGILVPKVKPWIEGQGVTADLEMKAPSGEVVGTVRQSYAFSYCDSILIDARITILASHSKPLEFGDSDDGGFAMRLTEVFRQDRKGVLMNSEGGQGTAQLWGKPARWVDYSANVESEPCGVTMMDHPKNFRHPTAWHARPYGLCSANPFAEKSFAKEKAKGISHTLAAGGKLEFAYRVWIHPEMGDGEAIERKYKEFAR